jgi:FkbM family methyltransferase
MRFLWVFFFSISTFLHGLDIKRLDDSVIRKYKPIFNQTASQDGRYKGKGLVHHKAQFKEDIHLYENYFFGMTGGIIVESGALDGDLFSTTYMFEKYFNWLPIHIEGGIKHYNKLIVNRPNAVNINAALCNESRTLHYLSRRAGSPVDGIIEFMEPRFIQRFHKMYSLQKTEDFLQEIQCMRFSDVLNQLGIRHIDLWVLDVEGAEYQVLQGSDFSKLEVDVIIVETVRRDFVAAETALVKNFLNSFGYTCTPFHNNEVCYRQGFEPSKKPNLRQKQ